LDQGVIGNQSGVQPNRLFYTVTCALKCTN
jgi:hypothetical protein